MVDILLRDLGGNERKWLGVDGVFFINTGTYGELYSVWEKQTGDKEDEVPNKIVFVNTQGIAALVVEDAEQ